MRKVFLLIAIVLLFSACGGQDDSTTSQVSDSYLKAALSDPEINLDPSIDWLTKDLEIFNVVYDSLYFFGKDGDIQPGLASEMPKISEDGKVYVIKLRSDVRFHDNKAFKGGIGRKAVAQDVVYSIKRIIDSANETGLFSLIQGRIEGVDGFRDGLRDGKIGFDDEISGLKAVGDDELQIRLIEPYSPILYVLGMPSFGIVPKEAVEYYGKDFNKNPVGTGPYKVITAADREIVMKRVDGHWRNKPGNPDGILFRYFDDAWSAFKDGNLDVFWIPSARLKAYVDDNYEIKKELAGEGYGLYSVEEAFRRFIIFNFNDPLMQNLHLRKAISYALPWAEMIDEEDKLSASFVPGPIDGNLDLAWEYNLEKAKNELRLAGYPDGKGLPELTFRIRYATTVFIPGMIEDALESIGLKIKIEVSEDVNELESAHFGTQGWVLDYPDASSIFYLLYSKALPPDGNNYGYFKNSEFDDMLKTSFGLPENKRKDHYEKMNKWLYDNAIVIPYRQTFVYGGFGPRIKNVYADALGYLMWPEFEMANIK